MATTLLVGMLSVCLGALENAQAAQAQALAHNISIPHMHRVSSWGHAFRAENCYSWQLKAVHLRDVGEKVPLVCGGHNPLNAWLGLILPSASQGRS